MKKVIKKQIFKINGKTYYRFEDIPEADRKRLDKNNNGVIDFVEDSDLEERFEEFKAEVEKKKLERADEDHTVRNRILILVFVGVALWFLYLFIQSILQ